MLLYYYTPKFNKIACAFYKKSTGPHTTPVSKLACHTMAHIVDIVVHCIIIDLLLSKAIAFAADVDGLNCQIKDSAHDVASFKCQINDSCEANEMSTCPVLFKCSELNQCVCIKRYTDDSIRCNNRLQTTSVHRCYCVTYDSAEQDIVTGYCFPRCLAQQTRKKLPHKLSLLNEATCKQWNREGILCGKCKKGFFYHAYSYNISCMSSKECTGIHGHWWQYILAAYVPLTVFYLLILVFRINLTSSFLQSHVIFCQIFSDVNFVTLVMFKTENQPKFNLAAKILVTFNGVWNLDFFRAFYYLCLKLDSLTIVALEYMIALYPLALSLLGYILLRLYDNNNSLMRFLWKPFQCVMKKMIPQWNIRSSAGNACGALFILSYSKVLSVSFRLLIPNFAYYVNSNETRLVLAYDGTKRYFRGDHLPFGILALVLCFIFNIMPILFLVFYQCRCFHWIITHSVLKRVNLQIVMDIFQGCYKDGTEPGSRDLRWFSSVYFLLRTSICMLKIVDNYLMVFVYYSMIVIAVLNTLVSLNPYKSQYSHYVLFDGAGLILMAIFLVSIEFEDFIKHEAVVHSYFVSFVLALIPLILIWMYILKRLIIHCYSRFVNEKS